MAKVNLILVYPPQRHYNGYGQDKRWIPLGLASLAAYVNQQNKDIEITCIDLFRFDLKTSIKEIISKIKDDCVNVVGFEVFTEQRINAFSLCEALKSYYISTMNKNENYKILTVVGGPHSSIMANQIAENYQYVDFICKGEGEKSLDKIIKAVKNDYYKKLDKIIESDHIDLKCSAHAFDGLKFFEDLTDLNDEAAIIMSRGCTDYCSFCSTTKVWKGYRSRTAYDVYSEMLKYSQNLGIDKFKFHDDACTGDIKEWKKLCMIILKYKHNWTFEITARIDHFDDELIELLKKAGCHTIAVGLESGNEELRKKMNKRLDMEKAKSNMKKIMQVDIRLICMFVIGYPGETRETLSDTKKLIREIKPDLIYKQPLMIFPGTRIYDECVKKKAITDDFWLKDVPQPYYTLEHTQEELFKMANDLDTAILPIRVLIAAPVNEDPKIFERYLDSLDALEVDEDVILHRVFVLDNCDEKITTNKRLDKENTTVMLSNDSVTYEKNENTHVWKRDNLLKVAKFKNAIVDFAKFKNFNYIFWVDSDIILQPKTLQHLINQQKDIISEVFWTSWVQGGKEEPNAWHGDQYSFSEDYEVWKKEGIYEVGGTGACILVNTDVYNKNVNYNFIKNVTFSIWEDRAFCIRASVQGHNIYLDTHYPAQHLYRRSEITD